MDHIETVGLIRGVADLIRDIVMGCWGRIADLLAGASAGLYLAPSILTLPSTV